MNKLINRITFKNHRRRGKQKRGHPKYARMMEMEYILPESSGKVILDYRVTEWFRI